MASSRHGPTGFYVGASYYPEHWPESAWPGHVQVMADLGFTVVRMLEFSWSRLEPEPGRYNFGWVDRIADLCGRHGLKLMLGTPTAAPPVWLTSDHPEILPIGPDGLPRYGGARRHFCLHRTAYRSAARRIVERLAEHLADRSDILAWQVDNEVGAYRSAFCYCDACVTAFRAWLQRRYRSCVELNTAWGSVFWSQEITSWEQVDIPRPAMSGRVGSNNAALLDFWRFSTGAVTDFVAEQADRLRAITPTIPVTTNWTSFLAPTFDPAGMAPQLDFTSWTNYELDLAGAAFQHDLVRGAKPGAPVWVAEQRCAPPDNRPFVPLLRDGEVTAMTLHNLACGADATIYFRLEQALFGAESNHGGILDRTGGTNTRIHRELTTSIPWLRTIGDAVAGAEVRAPVAIVCDAESSAALTSPLPHLVKARSQLIKHLDHLVKPWHQGLSGLGVDIDVVPAGRDLCSYQMVIVAGQLIMTDALAAQLRSYVAEGGCLITTPHTAQLDQHAAVIPEVEPAGLTDVLGIRIWEHDFLAADDVVTLTTTPDRQAGLSGRLTCDVIELAGANARYSYHDRWYVSDVAITDHRYGNGRAMHVGTVLDGTATRTFLSQILTEQHLRWHDLPDEVQVRRRYRDGVEFTFLINFADDSRTVTLEGSHRDLVTGVPVTWPMELAPRSGAVTIPTDSPTTERAEP